MADSKSIGYGAVAAGAVFIWAGIKGYSIPRAFQDVVAGKAPKTGQSEAMLTAAVSPSSSGNLGTGTGAAIAVDALGYKGHAYTFGGAPGLNGSDPWDCSSYCNWVIGHDMGLAIPFYKAGGYDGSSHGPPTTTWLAWTGCTAVGSDPDKAQPGDLAVWQTHMGICLGPNQMISAQDIHLGTGISSIHLPGELLFIRRLKAVSGG